jgi:hypothetical protein
VSVCIRAAALWQVSVKFGIGTVVKICRDIQNLFEIGKNCRVLYMQIEVRVTFAGNIKSPLMRCLGITLYQTVRIAEEV